LCEYPRELKSLALELTHEQILPNANGEIEYPTGPGLGMTPDTQALKKYLVEAEIRVNGQVLYQTPTL
jgi:L-alanine-DL-glutamate epimerase-like enolase superfamily enzyme